MFKVFYDEDIFHRLSFKIEIISWKSFEVRISRILSKTEKTSFIAGFFKESM